MTTLTCKQALQLLLDQVDFTAGACGLTDIVGQCVPKGVFEKCHAAIAAEPSVVPEELPKHDGYADEDEHFGKTIEAFVEQRLETDAEEFVVGFEFTVVHCYSRDEKWRVVSGPTLDNEDEPTRVERVDGPSSPK